MSPANTDFLSEEEVKQVILATLRDRPEGATEAEVRQCVQWARQARGDATLLAMVLGGELNVRWVDGDVEFHIAKNQ